MSAVSQDKILITGGTPLIGDVSVSGGKNAAVAIVPAALLCDEICIIENLPDIEDVHALLDILRFVGADLDYVPGKHLKVDSRNVKNKFIDFNLTKPLRASYYMLGAMLGRCGKATVASPGGCEIGGRPIDQHLKGFKALGAHVENRGGIVSLDARELTGNDVFFDVVSVGATINIMLSAVKANGTTIIYNAAKEPHIVDLANFLNSMGAKVKGAGTDVIRIRGCNHLHSSTYMIIPDQIETGTLMIAAAGTHGDVTIHNCIPTHMEALSAKLLEMGVKIRQADDIIKIMPLEPHRSISFSTQVYPGFPTDLQQPMTSLLTMANGISTVTETIFEQRFNHLDELRKMGANIMLSGRTAIITGVPELFGAPVNVTDLRAGAALIVSGLMATGVTEINGTEFIDRGYDHIENKLMQLGAHIKRE